MPKYALNDEQKQYARKLAVWFEQGLSGRWSFSIRRGMLSNIRPSDGPLNIIIESTALDNIYAFADAQLLELRSDDGGEITFFRFRKELIIHAAKNNFEIHPSLLRGGEQITLTMGDVINSNVGIDSRFENIAQTVEMGRSLPPELKSELKKLFSEMAEDIKQVPAEQAIATEAVEQYAEDIAITVAQEKPNPLRLRISAEGLAKAAANIAALMPNGEVVRIAVLLVADYFEKMNERK